MRKIIVTGHSFLRKRKFNVIDASFVLIMPLVFLLLFLIGIVIFAALPSYVDCEGKLIPIDYFPIYAKANGVVMSNCVYDGKFVTQGEFLFDIENEQIKLALRDIELQSCYIENELDLLLKKQHILQQKASLNLRQAKNEFEKNERLWQAKVVAREVYERSKLEWENSRISYSRMFLEIKNQIISISNRINNLKLEREKLLQNLSNTIYYSPIDGYIIYLNNFNPLEKNKDAFLKISLKEGTYVVSGLLLFYIIPSPLLQAELFIPENRIYEVSKGNEVLLYFMPFPYQKFKVFEGKITEISKSSIEGKFVAMVTITNRLLDFEWRGEKFHFDVYFLNTSLRAKIRTKSKTFLKKVFNLP
jgi:multidrug resistance efflux pump